MWLKVLKMALSLEIQQTDTEVPVIKISPSRISTYQDCPKKYDYTYNQNLTSLVKATHYFNKGNYFHELSHSYYELLKTTGIQPGSEAAVVTIRDRIQNDLRKASGPELISVYHTITRTMLRYIQEQSPKIDNGIKVIGTEQEINHLLTLPSGRIISLFGFIDLIYRDSSGRLHIRDHKTGERPWTKQQAASSNQLLYYSLATWLRTREVPIAEISYINTHEYVKKAPKAETAFAFPTVTYSQKELQLYLDQILQLIDEMLDSKGVPHYGGPCNWCPFLTPCTLERKGIDSTPIIVSQYKVVDRNAVRQHPKFTEVNSNGDDSDWILHCEAERR